jgi:hypothetical protein
MSTFIGAILVLSLFVGVAVHMINKKRKTGSMNSCSGCSGCANSSSCHK